MPETHDRLQILLTADEAFPCLERLCLGARTQITAGFRIFDPETRLRSEEARAVGDTWADLIAEVLKRGVRFDLVLADFDPVHRPELHRATHRSLRQLQTAARDAGAEARLTVTPALHPARSSLLHRVLFAPFEWRYLSRTAERLNDLAEEKRSARLADAPMLAALLQSDGRGRLRPRRVLPPMVPGSHHQKLVVIDRRHLYVGGLDLNERRFDDREHGRAGFRTWHDVQLCLTGPVAAVAEDHLREFRAECEGEKAPAPRPGILRTMSCARSALLPRMGPKPLVKEILERHLQEFARAERLVYIETQFLRDLRIARALAARAASAPDLGMIAVLPAAPDDVAFDGEDGTDVRLGEHLQARCIRLLRDAFGQRLCLIAPAQPRAALPDGSRGTLHGAPLVYVHAKVSIFDERCAIVGSANLNGRSLSWDTEVAVALTDSGEVQAIRDRLMRHWLPASPDPVCIAPETAPAGWAALAAANAATTAPADRQGFLLPYPEAAPRRFGRPVPGAPQEMV